MRELVLEAEVSQNIQPRARGALGAEHIDGVFVQDAVLQLHDHAEEGELSQVYKSFTW